MLAGGVHHWVQDLRILMRTACGPSACPTPPRRRGAESALHFAQQHRTGNGRRFVDDEPELLGPGAAAAPHASAAARPSCAPPEPSAAHWLWAQQQRARAGVGAHQHQRQGQVRRAARDLGAPRTPGQWEVEPVPTRALQQQPPTHFAGGHSRPFRRASASVSPCAGPQTLGRLTSSAHLGRRSLCGRAPQAGAGGAPRR